MKRSRKLFRRSRLELAADLDKSMPKEGTCASARDLCRAVDGKWHRVLVWWLRLMILPYVVIYAPRYFALYLVHGKLAAERAMPWKKLEETDFRNLPYVIIYAPLYFAFYLMYGKQAAKDAMPWNLKNLASSRNLDIPADEDDEEEWEGRALDMEKRTKNLLDPVKQSIVKVEETLTSMNKKMLERITKMEQNHATMAEKMDRIIDLVSASPTAQQQRRAPTCRPDVYTQEVIDARARGDRQRADKLLRRLEEWYKGRVRKAEAKVPPDAAKAARLRAELAAVGTAVAAVAESGAEAEGYS